MSVLAGLDIGGTKTAVVLGKPEEGGGIGIIDRKAFPTRSPEERALTPQDWRPVVARAVSVVGDMLSANGIPRTLLEGIGISCGGPLDSAAGTILSPPNLPGWDEVPITKELERTLGCRAFLQNDANACALAEWRLGAGRGCRNMVFLTFGTGMGAGLILGGRLYEGTNDLAGEVGHLRLAPDGPIGYGKRGSFEGFCSGGGIAQLARAAAEKALAGGRAAAFCPDAAALDSISARSVGDAALAGDPLALDILAESGRSLGRGLALIIDILNPERIVIGSIFARCERFLRPSMEELIAAEALPGAARVCTVVPSGLGERIGDYACLCVAQRSEQ